MRLILSDASFESILEEQYFLASKGGMSILDSNNIPDFERELFIGFLMKELHQKKKALESI